MKKVLVKLHIQDNNKRSPPNIQNKLTLTELELLHKSVEHVQSSPVIFANCPCLHSSFPTPLKS